MGAQSMRQSDGVGSNSSAHREWHVERTRQAGGSGRLCLRAPTGARERTSSTTQHRTPPHTPWHLPHRTALHGAPRLSSPSSPFFRCRGARRVAVPPPLPRRTPRTPRPCLACGTHRPPTRPRQLPHTATMDIHCDGINVQNPVNGAHAATRMPLHAPTTPAFATTAPFRSQIHLRRGCSIAPGRLTGPQTATPAPHQHPRLPSSSPPPGTWQPHRRVHVPPMPAARKGARQVDAFTAHPSAAHAVWPPPPLRTACPSPHQTLHPTPRILCAPCAAPTCPESDLSPTMLAAARGARRRIHGATQRPSPPRAAVRAPPLTPTCAPSPSLDCCTPPSVLAPTACGRCERSHRTCEGAIALRVQHLGQVIVLEEVRARLQARLDHDCDAVLVCQEAAVGTLRRYVWGLRERRVGGPSAALPGGRRCSWDEGAALAHAKPLRSRNWPAPARSTLAPKLRPLCRPAQQGISSSLAQHGSTIWRQPLRLAGWNAGWWWSPPLGPKLGRQGG